MNRTCWYQVNLQTEFGGAEVYTKCLTQALLDLNIPTRLIVHHNAKFWQKLKVPTELLIPVSSFDELKTVLPQERSIVITNGWLAPDIRLQLPHYLVGLAHLPLLQPHPEAYQHYHKVIGVSRYVIDCLGRAGIHNVMDSPLYGIVNPDIIATPNAPIYRQTRFNWDKRKGRDWLLSHLAPLYQNFSPRSEFTKRPGLSLGIVSRLTPIKQFPQLMQLLAPIIRQHPEINIEIFGSGGYASVRDLKQALKPIAKQVRFWGQQWQVGAVYRQLDYVLSGLPEYEALGLNLLEAQACNTPVLAVKAAPFTETVQEAKSGYFYTDPRQDQGRDFARLLETLIHEQPKLSPENSPHLARFTQAALTQSLDMIVTELQADFTQSSVKP